MKLSSSGQARFRCILGLALIACGPRPTGGTGGAGGSAGSSGAGGSGGSGGTITLRDCTYSEKATDGCATYVTPQGTRLQLGPYGGKMDRNVGQGFETAINALDSNAFCSGFVAAFGQDATQSAALLDVGDLNLALYTVYRPANWIAGEKYPLITWGNGTCAQPEGYGALLRYVASYGFIIVAANSRFVANGAMTTALDFMFAANNDASSPYYQRIDTSRVGAMGHSQGSLSTVAAAGDARVLDVILFNGGTTAAKPSLGVSGDMDIGNPTVDSYRTAVNGAPKAAFIFFHQVPAVGGLAGHLTLMTQPERVVQAATGWWQMMLNGDANARNLFVGASCGLCNRASEFEYGEHGL